MDFLNPLESSHSVFLSFDQYNLRYVCLIDMAVSFTKMCYTWLELFLCMQESQIKQIYGTMIGQKLQEFSEEMKPIGQVLTQATLELYEAVSAHFLPTPTKIHYVFNLRDISKVYNNA